MRISAYTVHESTVKGTVSQKLRWVLQYFKRKLFSKEIVAHQKNLILSKGQHIKSPTIPDCLEDFICGSFFVSSKC